MTPGRSTYTIYNYAYQRIGSGDAQVYDSDPSSLCCLHAGRLKIVHGRSFSTVRLGPWERVDRLFSGYVSESREPRVL